MNAPSLRAMSDAPRNGTLIWLWPRDGGRFLGYYSGKFFGWVSYSEPVPLIRGDIAFTGWEPAEADAHFSEPMKKDRRRGPHKVIRVIR